MNKDEQIDLLQRALWRYVTGDACDCDPEEDDPCHFCEGRAVLEATGVPQITGWTEGGVMDTAQVLEALRNQ
jgi:hypothetical protein